MGKSLPELPELRLPDDIIEILGLPEGLPAGLTAVCRSRIDRALRELLQGSGLQQVAVVAGTPAVMRPPAAHSGTKEEESAPRMTAEQRSERYHAKAPRWDFAQLIVPATVREELDVALAVLEHERQVFDTWGLRAVEPFPRSVLNFHGAPGTGKTLAAHAVAAHLGREILSISYADVESMYHGEGPKNIEAIFTAAERQQAVLFLDEADSLLSSRLTRVTQAAEQAINSMRSQLLICLEQYCGVVIFATNLVAQYDRAFETRVRHLHFPLPDAVTREAIWRAHLPALLPLAGDVDIVALAARDEARCGRDIKNAVLDAALRAARARRAQLEQGDFLAALAALAHARACARGDEVLDTARPLSIEESAQIAAALAPEPTPALVGVEEEDDEFDFAAV